MASAVGAQATDTFRKPDCSAYKDAPLPEAKCFREYKLAVRRELRGPAENRLEFVYLGGRVGKELEKVIRGDEAAQAWPKGVSGHLFRSTPTERLRRQSRETLFVPPIGHLAKLWPIHRAVEVSQDRQAGDRCSLPPPVLYSAETTTAPQERRLTIGSRRPSAGPRPYRRMPTMTKLLDQDADVTTLKAKTKAPEGAAAEISLRRRRRRSVDWRACPEARPSRLRGSRAGQETCSQGLTSWMSRNRFRSHSLPIRAGALLLGSAKGRLSSMSRIYQRASGRRRNGQRLYMAGCIRFGGSRIFCATAISQ